MISWEKNNDAIGAMNRGIPCESGLCTICLSSCKGKCEVWMSALRGRKMLYPRDFGEITAGAKNNCSVGVGYHSIRIQGYAFGANGLSSDLTNSPDDCIFPNVNIETSFGKSIKTKCKLPIMTGALGSTFIAAKYWNSFAIGAALSGFPIVIGENVVGVDKKSELKNGKIISSPELERRIDTFFRYYNGYGTIFVQMNVEDTKNGVAEYLINKYGDKIILELKWGQGAKDIGGEIQVTSIGYAQFLKNRGYIVDPDPTNETVVKAFNQGAIKSFARHSRLGSTDANSSEEVYKNFMESITYFRKLGFNKISLKTGAYGMEALALAIKCASDANLDLLTIDGAGGGTGMSPWNMMQEWGVPSILLHSKAYEYLNILDKKGKNIPDVAFAGGFSKEDHIFKALALGAPYTKIICMGRAPMIPGFLGSNIEGVFKPEKKEELNGHWDELPSTVSVYGTKPEEIFSSWETVKSIVGAEEMKNIPFGAIAMYAYADKLACGLEQFMAGARKFNLRSITRDDIMSANRETEKETKIKFITDALDDKAKEILNK